MFFNKFERYGTRSERMERSFTTTSSAMGWRSKQRTKASVHNVKRSIHAVRTRSTAVATWGSRSFGSNLLRSSKMAAMWRCDSVREYTQQEYSRETSEER